VIFHPLFPAATVPGLSRPWIDPWLAGGKGTR
jgi:hypothetical protein